MWLKKKFFKEEEGAALIVVALSLTVLLSFAALALDVGLAYFNRAKLQAACDSAALAAANQLLDTPSTDTCTETGKACFGENFTQEQLNSTVYEIKNEETDYKYTKTQGSAKIDKVYTEATMNSPTSFAKLFGIEFMPIRVKAAAVAAKGPVESIFSYAIFSDQQVNVSGGDAEISGIGSNDTVSFQDTHVTVNGTVFAKNGIKEDFRLDLEGSRVTGKSYEFDKECQKVEKYINENILNSMPGTSQDLLTSIPKWDNSVPSGWSLTTIGWTQYLTLNSPANYKPDINGQNDLLFGYVGGGVTINSNLVVVGNLNASGCPSFTINEGCTVEVRGNLTIGSGLKCNGNLVVTGNLTMSGNGFFSDSDSTSYILIKGKRISLGQATSNVNNVVICAPNCDTFSLNGGNQTTFTGRIIGKNLSDIGVGKLTVQLPSGNLPFEEMRNYYRLVQ